MNRREFIGTVAGASAIAVAGPAVRTASAETRRNVENTPVILECAINGGTTKAKNPLAPGTPAEHTAEVIQCLDAGASIIHMHSNQPNEDIKKAAQAYIDIYRPVWKKHPSAILYPTANFDPEVYHRERRPWPGKVQCGHQRLLAEAGVVNMVLFDTGVVPIGVYDKDGVPGPDSAFWWYGFWPDDVRYIMQTCKDLGTGASISVFEPGWMKNVVAMAKAGTLPRGSKLNIYFAMDNFAGLAPPIPEALELYLKMMEGLDLDWAVGYIGSKSIMDTPMARMALERGGSFRVGLEDWPNGTSNLEQLKRAKEIIKAFGDETLPWDVSDPKMIEPGWKDTVEAAEKFNDPGKFTAFIAYEWTSNPMGDNLHRVVIYRDNADKTRDILPFTSTGTTGSQDPEDLWKVLEAYEKKTGGKVLAIPHNGNWSSGLMFAETTYTTKKPLDLSYVTTRKRWEPLYEATQIKGDGEAHPFLSPDDEFADYETWDLGNLSFSKKVTKEMLPGSYARSGLKLGLKYQEKFGVNPFQFGMVGAGDSHTGLPGQDENNFMGKHASSEPDAERWETPFREADIGTQEGWSEVASGLAGIWATENTRAALWDAMKRKEVYATTGTRIKVRMFGGWDFKPGDDKRSDYVDLGYDKGVPMGGELHRAKKGKSPTFIVAAMKDPIAGNLDRVQMIKGWRDKNGNLQEKVYDIAWSDNRKPDPKTGKLPPVGNTAWRKTRSMFVYTLFVRFGEECSNSLCVSAVENPF